MEQFVVVRMRIECGTRRRMEPRRMSESWKKGAPRRVWRTVSPRGKTPGGVAFVNNDVEELRQRRIEAHLRGVMSPSGRPAAFERYFSAVILTQCCSYRISRVVSYY